MITMDAKDVMRPASADWPMAELSRMCVDLWGAFASPAAPQSAPGARLSQVEHIREYGEPYGCNGA